MSEITFQVEEDKIDGGWIAFAPGRGITTQAESVEELKEQIRDALLCHFDHDQDIPKIIRLHFVREEVFAFAV